MRSNGWKYKVKQNQNKLYQEVGEGTNLCGNYNKAKMTKTYIVSPVAFVESTLLRCILKRYILFVFWELNTGIQCILIIFIFHSLDHYPRKPLHFSSKLVSFLWLFFIENFIWRVYFLLSFKWSLMVWRPLDHANSPREHPPPSSTRCHSQIFDPVLKGSHIECAKELDSGLRFMD